MKLKQRIKGLIRRPVLRVVESILYDEQVRRLLWEIINRPTGDQVDHLPTGTSRGAVNHWVQLWNEAAKEAATYVEANMLTAPFCQMRESLLERSLSTVGVEGLYLEFGCGAEARSLNYIAERVNPTVHGFDSFEGLPDNWFGELRKGSLSTKRGLPTVRENVQLHAGLFEESLPRFLADHKGKAAFIHIDCDLYSSANTVLTTLESRIVPGTVIQFDEYFNYPGWKRHEYRAFQEFVERTGASYQYLGYSVLAVSVIMR